jgi:predicted HAD superfamily Cof-like phosphohydrolase
MDRTRLESYFKDRETTDIAEMHSKFNFTLNLETVMLPKDILRARADFIQEELNELFRSVDSRDLLETIDALIDIVVVAKGTAAMMGIRWKYHWDEVHRANMMKEIGNHPKRPELKEDLIKPPGWMGPDHLLILDRHGRQG